ncbi:hypothetical protein N4G40_02720 [Pantoea eucrina]|uniref:Uncharacterized protein n=1 Tax=Pantoea eucrina TaxID=472693 RepID=A0ABU5LBU7_9GAMM|nr:hypothetical protein [Pantoea eucrina]MDZ7277196.1 hypothetical protein [Pantoea eucrina]
MTDKIVCDMPHNNGTAFRATWTKQAKNIHFIAAIQQVNLNTQHKQGFCDGIHLLKLYNKLTSRFIVASSLAQARNQAALPRLRA